MVGRRAAGCGGSVVLSLAAVAGCGAPRAQGESSSSGAEATGAVMPDVPDEPGGCALGYSCPAEDDVCYHGECVPPGPCDDPGDCATPMVCVGERCVAPGPCDDGLDCAGGEVCEQNRCAPAAEVPACDPAITMHTRFAIDHGDGLPVSLAFRDGDGDAARELAIGVGQSVLEVHGGTGEAMPLLVADGLARVLRAADLDGDGTDELVIADATLRVYNGASGAVSPWTDFNAAGVLDVAIGAIDSDTWHAAAALWRCPYLEGCGAEIELAHFAVTAAGGLEFAGNQAITEPMLGLAIGHLGTEPHTIIVDIAQGFRTFGFAGADFLLVEDRGVRGAGIVAVADLDGVGLDEIVRLSPGEGASVASLYTSTGETLIATRRARFAGSLRRVAIGDVDGDAWADVVLAGDSQLVVWLGAGAGDQSGCAGVMAVDDAVAAIAVGDADGDGRDEVAVAAGHVTTVVAVE